MITTIAVKDANGVVQTIPVMPQTGQALSSGSLPVTIAFDQSNVPVTIFGTATVSLTTPIPTGSNTIGSVTVTNFPSTQVVSGNISVTNFPSTQVVSGNVVLATGSNTIGSVTVTNFPSTQVVSGNVALTAGANVIGSILGRTSLVSVTPTVTYGVPYVTGNEVGALLTFANVFDAAHSGVVQSIRIQCLSTQNSGFKLYLFRSNPTNSTWTDKTTPSIASADVPLVSGPFFLTSPDNGLGGTSTVYELDGVGAAFVSSTANLYGVLVTTGTPTFSSTSDITVSLVTLKD
jgi:hypothetical protein